MSPVIRKKKKAFSISAKHLLWILSGVCVVLMIFTFQTSLFEGPLKKAAGYVVVPFQEGITSVGGYLIERAENLKKLEEVLAENESLREKIDSLTIENSQLQQEKYELNNLRSLYQLDQEYADYKKTGARVIASETDNWFYSFIIDKGEEDGIEVDFNVMAGSGLVGRVVSVGPNYAKVSSIISDTQSVSATVLSTNENMIVTGDLEAVKEKGLITFSQLTDKKGKVTQGDKVVTSAISDKYLPGILIGYIYSVGNASDNLTKSGHITPAVDFSHLEEVLVIMERKKQIKE